MTVLVLSLVLAAAGCTGLVLAGRGMWQGWAVGLAVQPVWALFAIVTHGYGLLVTCLMYGTVYARNLLRWRKAQATRACTHLNRRVVFIGGIRQDTCASCGEPRPAVLSPIGVNRP